MKVAQGLTREEKIKSAKELREQQELTYREIGERLGVCAATAWKLLHPERTQQLSAKDNSRPERKAAKRQWEKDNRAVCPQCGGKMRAGSRCPSHRPNLCRPCIRANRRAKIIRFIELRERGFTNREIERQESLPYNAVAGLLSQARAEGFQVPPPPYWSRAKSNGAMAA